MKYVTFSFDDGVTQDKRLIELLNKYGLKATFNLNSSLFGLKGGWEFNGKFLNHTKVLPTARGCRAYFNPSQFNGGRRRSGGVSSGRG